VLDLLDGSATGNNGGQPRHLIELQGGFTKSGLGARLSGSWQSGTTVRGGTNSATGDLTFSDFAKADLRLFADLGQVQSIAKDHPWVRGMRLSLAITNITNNRIKVRDQTGATPLSYQGGYLDPLGRAVKFEVRKLFF
jgi:iron complex outermembrane receptor protein